MSESQVSPSKKAFSPSSDLSINIIPRISIFQAQRSISASANNEFCEVSTPLLPKRVQKKMKGSLQERRAFMNEKQDYLDLEGESGAESRSFLLSPNQLNVNVERNGQQMDLISPLGSSSCGEESPLVRRPRVSPLRVQSSRFDESFYKRIEEFLDLEKLHVQQPEDGRRKSFLHLRVSTVKIVSNTSSDICSAGVKSEYNSPSLISPSIHTSSLFQRRSTSRENSRDNSADAISRKNKTTTKSPFYLLSNQGKQAHHRESEVQLESPKKNISRSPDSRKTSPVKRPFALSNINTKLEKLSSKRDDTEASSATSVKDDENSPGRNDLARKLGLE